MEILNFWEEEINLIFKKTTTTTPDLSLRILETKNVIT